MSRNSLKHWKLQYSKANALSLSVNDQICLLGKPVFVSLIGSGSASKFNKDYVAHCDPIVTSKTRHQVELLQEKNTALSLWRIRFFTKFGIQGTTLNESLHSALKRTKGGNISKASFETLKMMLGTHFYKHNQRYSLFCCNTRIIGNKNNRRWQTDTISDSLFGSLLFKSSLVIAKDEWTNSDSRTLEQIGFTPKSVKSTKWSSKEMKLLLDIMEKISNNTVQPQTRNWGYYISHYIFEGSKSVEDVEEKIAQEIRNRMNE